MPNPPNDAYISACSPGKAWADGCQFAQERISERLDSPEVWANLGLDPEETSAIRLLFAQALGEPYAIGHREFSPSTEPLTPEENLELEGALEGLRTFPGLRLDGRREWLRGRRVWSMTQDEVAASRKRALDRLRSRSTEKGSSR
jgi:hypothetical protein